MCLGMRLQIRHHLLLVSLGLDVCAHFWELEAEIWSGHWDRLSGIKRYLDYYHSLLSPQDILCAMCTLWTWSITRHYQHKHYYKTSQVVTNTFNPQVFICAYHMQALVVTGCMSCSRLKLLQNPVRGPLCSRRQTRLRSDSTGWLQGKKCSV